MMEYPQLVPPEADRECEGEAFSRITRITGSYSYRKPFFHVNIPVVSSFCPPWIPRSLSLKDW